MVGLAAFLAIFLLLVVFETAFFAVAALPDPLGGIVAGWAELSWAGVRTKRFKRGSVYICTCNVQQSRLQLHPGWTCQAPATT